MRQKRTLSDQELARDLRRKFRLLHVAKIPVGDIAFYMGVMDCVFADDHNSRWLNACAIGRKVKASSVEDFAEELLCPLHLLRPIIVSGVDTGERRLFGLLKKRRALTNRELAETFGCSVEIVKKQRWELL